jgi:flagellar FliL protein
MLKFGKKKGGAEVPAVVEGEAPADGEAAPKKKKLPILFIAIGAGVLLLGGGGGAAFFLMQPKPAAAEEGHGEEKAGDHGKDKKDAKKDDKGGHGKGGGAEEDPTLGKVTEGPDGVTFLTLPDMVANVQSSDGRPMHLKLKLTLEMSDAHQVVLQAFLRELRPEELQGSAASFQLRAELTRRVNLILAPGKIDAVLIEEMLVQ